MSAFHEAFCFFYHNICYPDMPFCRLIKGGSNNFALDIPFHIGNFLRSLINKQDDEIHFRMTVRYCISDFLQQYSFPCFRLCHNESSLTFTNRSKHINHPAGYTGFRSRLYKCKFFIWKQWCQVIEWDPVTNEIRASSIYL